MDTDSLNAFLAVAKHQSFTQASAQLFITQSAISKRISQFEISLGVKLFDRIGHRTRLTEAGNLLLPRAEQILLAIDDCKRQLSNLNQEVSGTLKIGTSHHIGLHRLPKVLKQFKQEYPLAELNIEFQDSEEACRHVEQGHIELAIVTLPTDKGAANKKALVLDTLWVDQLLPVISPNHELAKLKKVSLQQIAQVDAILPAQGTFTRSLLESVLTKIDLTLSSSMATNYLETIKMLVSVGLGWSVLPKTMIDRDLKILRIKELEIRRPLGIVTHPDHSLSNAARALIKTLHSVTDIK